ncbi:MAG: c-type cytochrome [Brevundimonas sp.]|nr:c-type cytochrome [Brevundimonas sp.]
MRSPAAIGGLVGLVVLALTACQSAQDLVRGRMTAEPDALDQLALERTLEGRGALLFAFGDFGGLDTDAMETVAVPWRLTSAALVLAHAPQDVSPASLNRIMARYGFLHPAEIANWPADAAPPPSVGTLGVTLGVGGRSLPPVELQIGNIGCAACHAAPVYDGEGRPQPDRIWLGAPNPSLDLEAYTGDLFAALQAGLEQPDALIAATRRLHPDMSEREVRTLRDFVLPRVRARMARIDPAAGPLPFSNGLPGATNGVAALKLQHGLLADDPDARARETGFTSIPHLADRNWRSALLWDGAYAPPGQARFRPMTRDDLTDDHRDALAAITAYFTVPSMGVSGRQAHASIPDVQATWRFVETVRPQPFPGRIDAARAARGQAVYARSCASCHGTYQESADGPRLSGFPNWAGDVGTDPVRAQVMDRTLVDQVNASPLRRSISAARTGVYAAPPLTGLWQSAPYLHNGSAPSLAALLGLEPRPARFRVGGHALDLERVGVAYPEGYQPYSEPAWVDTGQRGLGAGGHDAEFADLSREQRLDLLEYLKRL